MKSIIMQPDSVAAILAGRKTQTRRTHDRAQYAVGDVIYVAEKYRTVFDRQRDRLVQYFADWDGLTGESPFDYTKWRSPFFMPEAAARLFLKITAVRQERLRSISSGDCQAEGIERIGDRLSIFHRFALLWDSINAARGYSSATNPLVWVYTFKVVEK